MRTFHTTPAANLVIALILFVVGFLLFIYRNAIGGFTDYSVGKYGRVDKPTPGWMLIPFAVALMLLAVIVATRTVYSLWSAGL